jgi:hypothetical protein
MRPYEVVYLQVQFRLLSVLDKGHCLVFVSADIFLGRNVCFRLSMNLRAGKDDLLKSKPLVLAKRLN